VTGDFRLEVLGAQHDRTRFNCGVAALDGYFRTQATQDARRRASACYVAVQDETNAVAGCYTLAAGSVAIDQSFQRRKLGAALLADAALRALRSEVAVFALVVDAKDDAAVAFYRHHGFEMYGGQPKQLIVPLASFSGAA